MNATISGMGSMSKCARITTAQVDSRNSVLCKRQNTEYENDQAEQRHSE